MALAYTWYQPSENYKLREILEIQSIFKGKFLGYQNLT